MYMPKNSPAYISINVKVVVSIQLKVPKREIFDRSDFPDFYTIKSSWVGDSVVKILTCYFNFLGSCAAHIGMGGVKIKKEPRQ
jgi:hypothetical protein